MPYIYNGQPITGSITIGDTQYPANWDWSTVEGVTWQDPPPPEPEVPYVPTQVSMRQARLILLQYGLLDTINATVATFPQAAQIEWEYASVVERSNPLIGMIGLDEAQLDAMFLAASLL